MQPSSEMLMEPHAITPSHLPNIRALRLEIRTRWKRPTIIPGPVIANVLRGALGITLRRLVCPDGWLDHDCHPCPLYQDCAYGQLFSPTPPGDSTQLRLQQDLPRPFVIEPPGLDPAERVTPDGLVFRLMLFGTAVDRVPYFISTLDRLGHDGMGRDRVPFTVERITACHPAGDEILFTGGSTTVSLPKRVITTNDLRFDPQIRVAGAGPTGSPGGEELRRPANYGSQTAGAGPKASPGELQLDSAVNSDATADADIHSPPSQGGAGGGGLRAILASRAPLADSRSEAADDCGAGVPLAPVQARRPHHNTNPDLPRITLRFLTPLLLKSGSGIDAAGRRIPAREIRDRPPFGVIIRRLRDRLSALCQFFGEPWRHPDFASLGTLADSVTLVDSRTVWLTRDRRSTRTGQQHEISGLVGHATYQFPDAETYAALAPLLKFGELLHVGKNAPWGNGALRCESCGGNAP